MKRPDRRPDTWMPFYVGDYLRDTGHLSAAEHGAYLLLIMQAWTRGGSLPTDVERLRLMCRLDRDEWDRAKDAVLHFFHVKDGCYRHKRVDRELNGAALNIEQCRAAGLASAAARRRQREATGVSTEGQRAFNGSVNERSTEASTDVPTEDQREGQRNGNPSPSPISKKETSLRDVKKAASKGTRLPDDWVLTPSLRSYAVLHGVDPDLAAEEFKNYWQSVTKNPTKLNWDKTFENRVIELQDRGKFRIRGSASHEPPHMTGGF